MYLAKVYVNFRLKLYVIPQKLFGENILSILFVLCSSYYKILFNDATEL
jgi:hypothetical protein